MKKEKYEKYVKKEWWAVIKKTVLNKSESFNLSALELNKREPDIGCHVSVGLHQWPAFLHLLGVKQ